MDKSEFNYRFLPRSRPIEQDPQWDRFLVGFSQNYPDYDSYRNVFFLIENGIGDKVCTLGLIRAFKDHFNAKNAIIICAENSRDLVSLYSDYDLALFYKDIQPFQCASGGRVFNVLHRPSKSYSNYGRLGPVFNAFCIPYIDQYRIGLGLPLHSQFVDPIIPSESSLYESTDFGNVVILFPYSNTWTSPPLSFWEKLATHLKSMGMSVYTNVLNRAASGPSRKKTSQRSNHVPLNNTLPLACSLRDLVYISTRVRGLIMNVSGPAWLLANASSKKVIFYEKTSVPLYSVRRTGGVCSSISIRDMESVQSNFPGRDFKEVEMDYKSDLDWENHILTIANYLE